MNVLNFFKRRRADKSDRPHSPLVDKNTYLLDTLKTRLRALGHNAQRNPEYMSLQLDHGIEISTLISENPTNHPALLQLIILTSHSKLIPDGIYECIVGIGTSLEDQINSVLNNYLNTTFTPIMEAFTDSHNPAIDILVVTDNKASLWHTRLGRIGYQGSWQVYPDGEPLFDLLKEHIKIKLSSNKFNWLKVYTSQAKDGTIISECNFNNSPWEEGQKIVSDYARSWVTNEEFLGMKQFMMFRRCDASDK